MDQKVQNRIKKRIGIAMRRFLLGTSPSYKYEMILGCDRDFLRAFLEHQFQDWMSWDNFTDRWQVGHIVPLSLFDQTNPLDIRACWNWINIRPVALSQRLSRLPYDVLVYRKKHFPSNQAIDVLIDKLRSGREDPVDWTEFRAKNKFHVVWEGDNDGH